ncbi:hypothetical protein BVU76_26500 [Mycolicibacterium porcinum]|nr:hypothetical protein BVU76_26500 [Mycolicibacterium porcinum]
MPRSFEFSIDSSATVEQIYEAFSDPDYWSARMVAFGGVGKLESLGIGDDGAVEVLLNHEVSGSALPLIVAKVYPTRWHVVQTETWRQVAPNSLRGEVNFVTHGAPGSGCGTALVTPMWCGSRLDCNAVVEFRVPLVGGKIESLVGQFLRQQFSMIQQFTAKWIARRAH